MRTRRGVMLRRVVAVAATIGVLVAMTGTAEAKAKACKKGYVRNKAKKCVRKATATTKKVTTTTAKPVLSGGSADKGTVRIGVFGVGINPNTRARTTDETKKIATAWETLVNRDGGINGYKVQVLYKDTDGDSAKALQTVKDFDKQGVITMAGHGDSTGLLAMLDVMRDKKLPLVGGPALDVSWETHPMLFNVGASYYAAIFGSPYGVKAAGGQTYRRVYCTESPACVNSVPLGNKAATSLGLKASAEGASAVAVDYTSNCISARNAGVDSLHNAGLNMSNLVRDCSRQGYHPLYAQTVTNLYQSTIDALKGERFVGPIQEMPVWWTGPEIQPFKAALKLTDLREGEYGQTAMQAWLGLETVKAALNHMTAVNPTRAQFVQALCTLKGETLNGQTFPMDYTGQCSGDRHSNNDCWFNDYVEDGAFHLMNKSGGNAKSIAEAYRCGTGAPDQPNK